MQLPYLPQWMKTLLAVLIGGYVLELLLRYTGLPIGDLAWHPFGAGFQPWQPFTRYLVQGDAVLGVVFGCLVLAFALPAIEQNLDRGIWMRGFGAGLAGGVGLPLVLDGVGLLGGGPVMGWSTSVLALFVIFGLALPDAVVKLFFVLDVKASALVWMAVAFLGVFFVVNPSLSTADGLGTWCGVVAWWYGLGP